MATSNPAPGRLAVLGGGISGAAAALAYVHMGRLRSRMAQAKLFRGGLGRQSLAPAVLGPECRSRLAGMGVGISTAQRTEHVLTVEVRSGNRVAMLPAPPAGLWVMDDWLHGEPGRQWLGAAIATAAERAGVEISLLRPELVERHPPDPGRGVAGELVVRAGGRVERFQSVALATGASEPWGERFFPGFRGAPTLPACEARLRFRVLRPLGSRTIRFILSPREGMDGLFLIPAGPTVYALAYGPGAGASDLCEALMSAARDRLLPESFEIAAVRPTAVPAGAGRRLVAPGRLAVGTAAYGHPLQLGVAETLAGCARAALALVDGAWKTSALERRYVTDGLEDLLRDASAGARSALWLARARERGVRALDRLVRGSAEPGTRNPFSTGILGLGALSPRALLPAVRWAGLCSGAERLVREAAPDPLTSSRPVPEPDLYYVVDDDDEARDALVQLLESQGAEVVAFSSELALYAAVARRPPTAILLDVVLRWVDGLHLCQGLKQHPSTRGTPIFVMSGLDLPHVREGALAAGAEAFLPKPLAPQLLRHLVASSRTSRADGLTVLSGSPFPAGEGDGDDSTHESTHDLAR